MKFFDVNLRPPFADPPLVMDLARRADVLKLNDGEVGQLAHWVRTGELISDTPRDDASIARDCQTLAEATGSTAFASRAPNRAPPFGNAAT